MHFKFGRLVDGRVVCRKAGRRDDSACLNLNDYIT